MEVWWLGKGGNQVVGAETRVLGVYKNVSTLLREKDPIFTFGMHISP